MSFDRALPLILRAEGGYVADPNDHGGATNHGVTQGTYDNWREAQSMPFRDVLYIGDDEIRLIYLGFWNNANCPVMPWPLSLVHFDARVNHRPNRANLVLQESLSVKMDGIVGPATLAAAAMCVAIPTAMMHCEIRERFYNRIVEIDRTQEKFLKGWRTRLDHLRAIIAPEQKAA